MTERGKRFTTSVITKGKLEVRHKNPHESFKISMRRGGLVNIPLRRFSSKHTLEQPKTDEIIDDGVR